jgi:hypothetical protein
LAQHVLALGLLRRGLAGRHGTSSGLDDILERAALVGCVALDRLDEVADEVVPAGELDVDLAPASCTRLRSLMRPLYVAMAQPTTAMSSTTMAMTMTRAAVMGLLEETGNCLKRRCQQVCPRSYCVSLPWT